MSPLLTVALLGVLLAAPESGSPPPPGAELRVWVIEASDEDRKESYVDSGLEKLRDAIVDTDHDTYKLLKTEVHAFRGGGALRTALSGRYTLATTLPAKSEDGRYRFALRVTMPSDKPKASSDNPLLQTDSLLPPQKNTSKPREIEALSSKLSIQPEEKVVVRGLKTDAGKEMVIVLSLTVPAEEKSE